MKKVNKPNVTKLETTLRLYIQKGYEAGVIPNAEDTPEGNLGEIPNTYQWYQRQLAALNAMAGTHKVYAASRLLQHMKTQGQMIELQLEIDH